MVNGWLIGGFKPWNFIFRFIYGMSSFPLTNSYFSRWLKHVKTTNQIMNGKTQVLQMVRFYMMRKWTEMMIWLGLQYYEM